MSQTFTGKLELVRPHLRYEPGFREMVEEYRRFQESRFEPFPDDFRDYVQLLREWDEGVGLESGYVPMSVFWLVRGRSPLGVGQLRHRLTPALEKEGGHIGYDIRPTARRKGYGTLLMALLLDRARERGIVRALVTCDADNAGSRKIIEKNGGLYAGSSISDRSGKEVLRYWVDTAT